MQPYVKRVEELPSAARREPREVGRHPAVLSAENIKVSFGGFIAVDGMNLTLHRHELHFLIGPNGAGKTTMLDVICGKTKPAQGRVKLGDSGHGTDLTGKKEHEIAGLGIGRKFQAPSVFPNLSVKENLELTLDADRSVLRALRIRRNRCTTFEMKRVLERIGLPDRLDVRAGSLSHGEKQWLEIGMLLLQKPRVLLLDEPAAGMTDEETVTTGELLREIAKDCSVVVVEHDMDFVRSYAAKVTVMHEGRLLKEGTMAEIQRDPVVAEVYLGKRRDGDAQAAGH